jgi:hypothetical protein
MVAVTNEKGHRNVRKTMNFGRSFNLFRNDMNHKRTKGHSTFLKPLLGRCNNHQKKLVDKDTFKKMTYLFFVFNIYIYNFFLFLFIFFLLIKNTCHILIYTW